MIEPSKEAAQRHRRANWVGLRTLRQRPKLVGATDDGEPVYEVRSVRIVLLGTSPHFTRLAPCSRCGRELPGTPVTTLSDLDIELRPMICADCIRGTGITSVWDPDAARRAARGQELGAESGTELARSAPSAKQEPLSPLPEAPPAAAAAAVKADADVATGDRLAAMERHLGAVTARVNELGRRGAAQHAQAEEHRRRDADASTARDPAVDRALAELRAELASAVEGDRAADVHGLEDRLNERLAEIMAAQREELAAVVAALTELGAEVHRLSQATDELARAQEAIERRVADPAGERIEALENAMQLALRSRPPRHAASPRNGGAEATNSSMPAMAAASTGDFLESLERQLEAAAGRLAARSDAEPDR